MLMSKTALASKPQEKKFFNSQLEIKNATSDEEFFYIEGYAAVFNQVDAGGDKILKGAFEKSIARNRKDIKFYWQHDISQPLGAITDLYEDNYGLFFKAKLPLADDLVRGRVMPQVKSGNLNGISFGYFTVDSERSGFVRLLKEVELYEISIVSIPMNKLSRITAAKSFDTEGTLKVAPKEHKFDSAAALKRWQEHTDSAEAPSEDYRKGFLYVDEEKAADFDAYKMLVVDVIDGEPYLVPDAVFAITAAMYDIKSKTELPQLKKEEAQEALELCYKKMNIDSPFVKGVALTENEALHLDTVRDLENFLVASGACDKKGATLVASRFRPTREAKAESQEREANDTLKQDLSNFTNNLKQTLQTIKG